MMQRQMPDTPKLPPQKNVYHSKFRVADDWPQRPHLGSDELSETDELQGRAQYW